MSIEIVYERLHQRIKARVNTVVKWKESTWRFELRVWYGDQAVTGLNRRLL